MSTVFVSYSRVDEDKVNNIIKDIETLGHDVWFDNELSGGQNWWEQILSKIRSTDIFVFVLSPKSVDSTACKREYCYADALKKPLIPVQVADGISTNLLPPELSKIQIVNYRNPDRDAAFRFAKALNSISSFSPLPTPLPVPPEVPISYLGNISAKVASQQNLSIKEQSSLLFEIKQLTRDDEFGNDALILLNKFLKRRDIYARIDKEADEILHQIKVDKAEYNDSDGAMKLINSSLKGGKEQSSYNEFVSDESIATEKIELSVYPTTMKRVLNAIWFSIVGMLIWLAVTVIWGDPVLTGGTLTWDMAIFYATRDYGLVGTGTYLFGWIVSGLICANRRLPILLAITCVAFLLSIFIANYAFNEFSAWFYTSFFTTPGLILSAMTGVYFTKRKKESNRLSSVLLAVTWIVFLLFIFIANNMIKEFNDWFY